MLSPPPLASVFCKGACKILKFHQVLLNSSLPPKTLGLIHQYLLKNLLRSLLKLFL